MAIDAWEQLLAELPLEIAEEFRAFVGYDETKKQILLDNYLEKKTAIAAGDTEAFARIIELQHEF
ncbi:MAG: hypothetical protein AAB420_04095 [Patescibacteria group bacterium]